MNLKTPAEWCIAKSIYIMDPDGWRGEGDPSWETPISEEDFDNRAAQSTVGPWAWWGK